MTKIGASGNTMEAAMSHRRTRIAEALSRDVIPELVPRSPPLGIVPWGRVDCNRRGAGEGRDAAFMRPL